MEQAIFGLVGVLIGGLITWGIEWWREHQRLAGEELVAARLVATELIQANAILATRDAPGAAVAPPGAPVFPVWEEHRAVLARTLDAEAWGQVQMAVLAAEGPQPLPDAAGRIQEGLMALLEPGGLEPESDPRD